jgi:hypothetical protein
VLKLTALLAAFILILAGCTSDSAPDPASGPLVVIGTTSTRTSTSTTTTTRVLIDPTECSGADLHGEVENYPGAYDGLTNAVWATRKAIIEAALSCDFATLMTIAAVPFPELGPGADRTESIFGGATTDFDEFVAYDQQHSALRKLVMALSSVPVELVESEDKDRVPVVFYIWPPSLVHLWDGDTATMRSLDQVWDDDTIERLAALNGISADELVAAVDGSGDYALFTVAILEDGRWMGAFAGPRG